MITKNKGSQTTAFQTVDKEAKARHVIIVIELYRMVKVTLAKTKSKTAFIEKWLEHCVQATFGAFCLLLGGSTLVQLPLAKYKIYLTFSKSTCV